MINERDDREAVRPSGTRGTAKRDLRRVVSVGFLASALIGLTALLAAGGCGGRKAVALGDAESCFEAGNHELRRGRCVNAAELFRRVIIHFPGSGLADDAQFGLGEAHLCGRDYMEAIFEYQRVIDEYPTSPLVDDSRYKIAVCYEAQSGSIHLDQTETKKAIAQYRQFIEDFPDSRLVPDARRRMLGLKGRLAAKEVEIAGNYLQWGYPESARIYYQHVLDAYGDTPMAEEARLGLAMVKVKKGKVEEARAALQKLLSGSASRLVKKRAQEQIEELRDK